MVEGIFCVRLCHVFGRNGVSGKRGSQAFQAFSVTRHLGEYASLSYIEMSLQQESQRPHHRFGNPFKMILSPKGSYLSPKLLALLNSFEQTLAGRLKSLKPGGKEDILSLSWMTQAISTLCAVHTDVKTLITDLELPVSDWDEKWIGVYLDNSLKMLDMCVAYSSEISRLSQGHLYLQCSLHKLDGSSTQLMKARSSLDGWKQHINAKNHRLENCFAILDSLTDSLNLPKIKYSAKGKVLMHAMYGVRVATVFVCSIFAVAFSGSAAKLKDLQVLESCLWTEAFVDLRDFISGEIRGIYSGGKFTALKELEELDVSVKKIYPVIQDGVESIDAAQLELLTSDLTKKTEKFSVGLDILANETDKFFQILLTGRDALLCNLRVGSAAVKPSQPNNNVHKQMVK